jgi:integrase
MSLKLRNGIWHWRKEIDGHKFARSTKTGDQRLAEKLAAVWEGEAISSLAIGGTKEVTLFRAIDAFLADRKQKAGYASALLHTNLFRCIGNVPLKTIRREQVQEVINKRRDAGIKHNTCSVTVAYWNAIQNMCIANEWTHAPKLPVMAKLQTRIRTITQAEEDALLAALDPSEKFHSWNEAKASQRQDNYDMTIVFFDLGLRYSEAAMLRWEQIDIERGSILVRRLKRGVDGTLLLTTRLHAVMKRRWETRTSDELVFPTKIGKNNAAVWLKAALVRAGLKGITPHTFRHTMATRLVSAGMPIIEVQQQLGHRALASTLVYAHAQTSTVATRARDILNK